MLRTPYIQSFNLTLQRQLRQDLMVEASYVGKIGIKLEGHRHWNPAIYINSPRTGAAPSAQNVNDRVLYPEMRGILTPGSRVLGNDYRVWFHSFQGVVNKRFSKGFTVHGFLRPVEEHRYPAFGAAGEHARSERTRSI